MLQTIIWTIKPLLLPPGLFILLMLWGLWRLKKQQGKWLLSLSVLGLYALSIPIISNPLSRSLQQYPAITPQSISQHNAQAIILLGGGLYPNAPEYQGDTISHGLLIRTRYAAHLSRMTGLPIIPTGGSKPIYRAEADVAKDVLENEFHVPVLAIENKSRTTFQNAQFTRQLLQKYQIHTAYLVTHAYHMPRAMMIFQHHGIHVIAAPTLFTHKHKLSIQSFIPTAGSLYNSSKVIHEYIGQAWYQLKISRSSTPNSPT